MTKNCEIQGRNYYGIRKREDQKSQYNAEGKLLHFFKFSFFKYQWWRVKVALEGSGGKKLWKAESGLWKLKKRRNCDKRSEKRNVIQFLQSRKYRTKCNSIFFLAMAQMNSRDQRNHGEDEEKEFDRRVLLARKLIKNYEDEWKKTRCFNYFIRNNDVKNGPRWNNYEDATAASNETKQTLVVVSRQIIHRSSAFCMWCARK